MAKKTNATLMANSRTLAEYFRVVKSKKKEDELLESDQIPEGGVIVVVSYGDTHYIKVTDGNKKFSDLNKLGEGEDAGSVAFEDITGSPDDNPTLKSELDSKAAVSDVNAKVAKIGDTMTGPLDIFDPENRSKLILGKYLDGTGHQNAPTTLDKTAIYLHLGGTEFATNSYRLIGFGYRRHDDQSHAAAVMGYEELNSSTDDNGRLIFGTRPTNTDIAPTIRLTIEPNGDIKAQAGSRFAGDGSLLTNLPAGAAPTWASITGKPAVIAAGATAQAARNAIGAGDSTLQIGATGQTAMAGNKHATYQERGGVLLQAELPHVTDEVTKDHYNNLLLALREAGIFG